MHDIRILKHCSEEKYKLQELKYVGFLWWKKQRWMDMTKEGYSKKPSCDGNTIDVPVIYDTHQEAIDAYKFIENGRKFDQRVWEILHMNYDLEDEPKHNPWLGIM